MKKQGVKIFHNYEELEADLIKNKEATAREKDLEDIKQLKLKNEPPKNP